VILEAGEPERKLPTCPGYRSNKVRKRDELQRILRVKRKKTCCLLLKNGYEIQGNPPLAHLNTHR
jgi:hypothetical protein